MLHWTSQNPSLVTDSRCLLAIIGRIEPIKNFICVLGGHGRQQSRLFRWVLEILWSGLCWNRADELQNCEHCSEWGLSRWIGRCEFWKSRVCCRKVYLRSATTMFWMSTCRIEVRRVRQGRQHWDNQIVAFRWWTISSAEVQQFL